MTVYLIHYERPIGNLDNPHGTAQHYIGWCKDLDARLHDHATGNGSHITRAFHEQGIAGTCARTWAGGRPVERRLKSWHKARQLCPICQAKAKESEEKA